MVGAAAMRQVAEDASAHSAVKEGSIGPISYVRNKWQKFRLRSAAEEVAKKNFPEEERQYLTDAVMKAFENGELDKGLKNMSREEKQRHLLTTMQQMQDLRSLRSAAEEVAKKNFPEEERQYLTDAVMKAFENGELDKGLKNMSREEKQRHLLTTMQQMQDLRSLRSAAEEVAKKNIPEKEQQKLTEAVMKAFKSGELDKGLKEMSWEEKQRHLLTTMQTMREEYLRSAAKMVAKRFPEKEQHHLTEAMMEAFKNGELDKDHMSNNFYLLRTMNRLRELPVAASAVKFCSELFREVGDFEAIAIGATQALEEADEAAGICHKVLTGELGADDGPEWAEKAANSSQPDGQHYQLGRLQKVDATEIAWKVSLKNVCKDECIELVKKMKEEAEQILGDVVGSNMKPYEEVCAKRVVHKVEAEILGCCAESCGWNGRACMYWPFLNSTEKGQWEAECCTEFNILKNSSRATMCDATLTGKENKKVIRDPQPNTEEDREMIGQDPVLKGTSFLQEEDTNGPNPPPENTPIPPYEGTCPDPLNLGKEHSKLKGEWKTTNFQEAKKNHFKKGYCLTKPPNVSIGNCTAFLPQGVDGKYVCYGECLGSVDGLVFTNLTDTVPPSVNQLLYVHKSISGE